MASSFSSLLFDIHTYSNKSAYFVAFFQKVLTFSFAIHTRAPTHTHLAPSASSKRCDLCRDLHAQIMFVSCFANQILHNCLFRHTQTHTHTHTHTHENRDCAERDRVVGCVAGELHRPSDSPADWQPVGHHVVVVAVFTDERCCVGRSHFYHFLHPPPHQPPPGTVTYSASVTLTCIDCPRMLLYVDLVLV